MKNETVNLEKKTKPKKPEINNEVKDIEYLTTDKCLLISKFSIIFLY